MDFGASATKVAWRDSDGTGRLVGFDGTGQFETSVYISADLSAFVYIAAGSNRQLYGFKQRIGEPGGALLGREIAVGVQEESVPLIEPVSAILGHGLAALRNACDIDAAAPGPFDDMPVVLTHPVLWGEPERQFLVQALIRSSPQRALTTVHFVTEPEAACAYAVSQGAASFAHGPIAVFDIGAGTLDIAVIEKAGEESVTLASDGSFTGGDDLDNILLLLVQKRLEDEHGRGAAAAFARSCREQAYSARAEARRTKESLSTDTTCVFAATLAGDDGEDGSNVDVEIDRSEFETRIAPVLAGWKTRLEECLASLPSRAVPGTILCSGGTSLIPALQAQLRDVALDCDAHLVVLTSTQAGPGQCVALGALEVLQAREDARLAEEARRRREAAERQQERARRERAIRRHNEEMIDDAIRQNTTILRGRADALLERIPEDEELIKVIRFKALKGYGVSSYLFDQWSLMALSSDRMTIEPVVGDGWWRCTEVESFRHGEVMNNMIIQFRRDRLWVGYITSSEYEFIGDWCNERF